MEGILMKAALVFLLAMPLMAQSKTQVPSTSLEVFSGAFSIASRVCAEHSDALVWLPDGKGHWVTTDCTFVFAHPVSDYFDRMEAYRSEIRRRVKDIADDIAKAKQTK